MIKVELGQTAITHIKIDNRIYPSHHFDSKKIIKLCEDGTGWFMKDNVHRAAVFYIEDPLHKLDLKDKNT